MGNINFRNFSKKDLASAGKGFLQVCTKNIKVLQELIENNTVPNVTSRALNNLQKLVLDIEVIATSFPKPKLKTKPRARVKVPEITEVPEEITEEVNITSAEVTTSSATESESV